MTHPVDVRRLRLFFALLFVVGAGLTAGGAARAGGYFPPELNRTEYRSPSGRYRLTVDPTQRLGGGPGRYRLTRDGKEVWSGERRFTFWKAAVADDGTSAGFAYLAGEGGRSKPFLVALLGAQGTVRLQEETPREASQFFHTPPHPLGAGVVLDPENDRLIVRVDDPDVNRDVEAWWVYRLSTAKPWKRLEPKLQHPDAGALRSFLAIRPVPGTPLILTHWWRYDTSRKRGAAFTLVDPEGRPVWRLDLPDDYELPDDGRGPFQLRDELAEGAALLDTSRPRRFTLRSFRTAQAISFEVGPAADGRWSVRELERLPYVALKPKDSRLEELPHVELKPLGKVTLRNPRGSIDSEIRDISEFACADRGRIGFIRVPTQGRPAFVLVEPNGKARAFPLPPFPREKGAEWRGCIWLGGDRFLAVRSSHFKDSRGLGWWIDTGQGTVRALAAPLPAIKRICPLPDGGFVVLTWSGYDNALAPLYAYGRAGEVLWKIDRADPTAPDLDAAKDLCRRPDGSIAVLAGKESLLCFEPSGKFLQKLKLDSEKLPYFPSLRANAEGFTISDTDRLLLLNPEGKYLKVITADFSDFDFSPDGRLWTTDGSGFQRLDAAAKPDRRLGPAPDPARLQVIASAFLEPDGRFYAVDQRTQAVHVFDRNGKPLHVLKPLPTDRFDFSPIAASDHPIISDPLGNVYVGPLLGSGDGWASPASSRYLRFSREGKRLGPTDLGKAEGKNRYFQPTTHRSWVQGYEGLTLLNAEGRPLRVQVRRPDGMWIGPINYAAMNGEGAVAILEGTLSFRPEHAPPARLSLFSPTGEALRTFDVPLSAGSLWGLSVGPRYAAITGEHAGLLLSLRDGRLQRFDLPAWRGSHTPTWKPFLNAAGTELFLYDTDRTFYRFRLPNPQR